MNETLFALVLIFSPTATNWTEEIYKRDLPFAACDAAQKAVWAQEWETVGYDASGAIPSVDAYCVEMSQAPIDVLLSFSVN